MGEAKRRLEAVRAAMLVECDQWSAPHSDDEASALAELIALPSVKAIRATDANMRQMGMSPKDCHENCLWYTQNNPDRDWEHVFGWWKQPSALVLHSVIRRKDEYVCITPQSDRALSKKFLFIPDDTITTEANGDHFLLLRNGINHHPGLRLDPAGTIEYMAKVKARLQTKMNPFQAWEIDYLGEQFTDFECP